MEEFVEHEKLASLLNSIGNQVEDDHSEREVELMFLNQGFFRLLGYEDVGTTLRSEYTLPSGKKADFITSGQKDEIRDSQTVVYEFKSPGRKLTRHEDQLFGYMTEISAEYGVLTNGQQLRLYQNTPTGPRLFPQAELILETVTEGEASMLIMPLGYLSIEERNIRTVAEHAAEEVVETISPNLQLDYSEPQLDVFADHFADYLRDKYREAR
ncbi:type i restriction-modification system methyltransferase subunit [Natrialba hulunbeirensis JCM 10989]|uniref:Type i restriction-modification system methyltransferase subunit n=1 Tax=Natrialba hulunbeirensis JCM 10989 TaxID=1227493 RepID=M0ABS0_9EURY|nr:type I restriction enzyme HsdR N-terminal domain-containing protein [Natrialba hulunbeirensis]ELY96195.1 type i restriction-modification system methyltransferase subunit [Natrialba hulunbeirensis JCM 10989]